MERKGKFSSQKGDMVSSNLSNMVQDMKFGYDMIIEQDFTIRLVQPHA